MTTAFSARLLGQTEKALNVFLLRELAGSGIDEPQWIALTLTVMGEGALTRRQLTQQVAGGLQVDDEQAGKHVDALVAAGLFADGDRPVASPAGHELWTRVRTFTVELTQRLWGDLPDEELDTAARVLSTVLARAQTLLA
jgi:DNA-binding MarR family transcriptional regulator